MMVDRHGADVPEDDQADGQRRLDGRRLAGGVRRPRARRGRAADLRQRGPARRRAPAGRDAADRRPDAAGGTAREKQKELFLGRILAGDVHFAIGYTEPDAGTDLASLRTTARRDGDHYVVNGQKTLHHRRPRGRLRLARRAAPTPTPPSTRASRSSSSTPTTPATPGRRSSPPTARTTSTRRTTTTCGCRSTCWSARRTQGWRLITTQLNHERVMLGPAGRLEGLRDRVAAWAGAARRARRARRTPGAGRGDRRVPGQRAAQLAGRPRRRAGRDRASPTRRRRRSSPPSGCSASAGLLADGRAPVRRPGRPGDRRPGRLPRRPGQAQPGAHLRRRRQRGAARADRDVRARACRGCRDERPATSTTGSWPRPSGSRPPARPRRGPAATRSTSR